MKITILTLFPEYFDSILGTSMIKRAQEKGSVDFQIVNIRDFAQDKHKLTDDRPFGGGPGMVMLVEPIDLALQSLGVQKNTSNKKIILTSAKGKKFDQSVAREYANLEELVLICGHYEGVDERVAQNYIDEEVRIGDYVLTGGEPAVAVMLDAVTRLLPGVLGNEESNLDESHSVPGKLGYPAYSRPAEYKGMQVPEVLLSGDHKKIAEWRKGQEKKSE
ncbi:tRNA (guanosine(37)-N1)-methyltransferase TrmD [Candidatus Woesebacteria bacterium]|nr:tRNA (guanosine(37)-N1)-methyltransferase TrmD [Candidatus Woesebacteria bacterium]